MKQFFYRRMMSAVAVTVFATGLLVGCGSVVRNTYDLTIADMMVLPQNKKQSGAQVLIADPQAVKSLDGQDIVIRQGSNISYLKGAQWSDRLPNLVQARLVQAFENSGRLAGVGRPGDGLAIDYQILTDIRSFDILVSGGKNVARIEVAVKLMNDKNGTVRATRVFTAQKLMRIVDNGFGAAMNQQYATALDEVFRAIVADIVSWSLSNI